MDRRTRVLEILEPAKPGDVASRVFDIGIVVLISLNVLAFILATVPPIHAVAPKAFGGFELFSVVVFATEYLLRLWSCTASPNFPRPLSGRVRFALRPLMVLDLLAIVPAFVGGDLRFLRVLRLLRILRVVKAARYSVALQTFRRVLVGKREELVTTFFVLLLLLVFASCLLYEAESGPAHNQFVDIPTAMWWCLSKITRLGLSDLAPVTVAGNAVAALMSILGIAVIALPAGILSAGFIEEMRKSKLMLCPHCGGKL